MTSPYRTPEERLAAAARRPEADPVAVPGATVFETPEAIERFRVISILMGLKLEATGIRVKRGASCLATARRDYGIKARTARDAYRVLGRTLVELGIIPSLREVN